MSTSPVTAEGRAVVGRFLNRAFDEDEHEAVDQFVARVLRQAHQSAEARNAPSEARAILEVAHLFADEWIAGNPGFDRFAFVEAATEGPS